MVNIEYIIDQEYLAVNKNEDNERLSKHKKKDNMNSIYILLLLINRQYRIASILNNNFPIH